ncbi:MAG: extracellular solute-binding protein [Clostridiales bacterium]|nr:extracellular solute-binding protein [Clostridiales bacterium]
MKKHLCRSVALLLCAGFLLSSGCSKKKEKQRRVISASDPYFSAEEVDLPIPVDEGATLISRAVDYTVIFSEGVAISYMMQYAPPEEKKSLLERYSNNYDSLTEEEQGEARQVLESCTPTGLLVYGFDGKLKCDIRPKEDQSIIGAVESADGKLRVIINETEFNETVFRSEVIMYEVGPDGQLTNAVELKSNSIYATRLLMLPNGNLLGIGTNQMIAFDKTGKVLTDTVSDGDITDFLVHDGKYYVWGMEYDEYANVTGYYLREIDQDTGRFKGEKIKYENKLELFQIGASGDGSFFAGGEGIFRCDPLKAEKGEAILRWEEADINRFGVTAKGMKIISNDELYVLRQYDGTEGTGSFSDTHVAVIHLKRQDKNPHAGKPIIEIACNRNVVNSFLDHVAEYNRDPESRSHIVVRDYSDAYSDGTAWSKVFSEVSDAVYLDLLSGDGPDILVNFGAYSQFEREDILTDLNQFIDGTSPLSREEYFDNIFRAYETDGKLYQIPLTFAVQGLAGNSDLLGDRTSWNYEEFDQVAASLPSDIAMIEETDRRELLEQMMNVVPDLIDYSSKTVHYADSADFSAMLELIRKYGSERDYNQIYAERDSDRESPGSPLGQFNSGSLAVVPAYIADLGSFWEYAGKNKGNVTFVGYPGSSKKGMAASDGFTMGIAQSSQHKEEAWDFIRFLLGKEAQYSLARDMCRLPVSRTAWERVACDNIASDRAYRMLFGFGTYGDGSRPLTEDMEAPFRKMLENVHGRALSDPTAMLIVCEEAPAYFTGQKSLADVVSIIQNRCATIVKERG